MNLGLWQRLRQYSLRELAQAMLRLPGQAVELLKLPEPATVKRSDGVVVPMPTLPPEVMRNLSEP